MQRVSGTNNRPLSASSFTHMKAQLPKHLKLNNGVEDVFNMLDPRFDCSKADEFDLEKKTNEGNTLLHCVINASLDHPVHMDYYIQLVDLITMKSVTWWCKRNNFTVPEDEAKHDLYKHDAMKFLLSQSLDKEKRSVWKLAFEKVAVDMIRKLMYLEGVTCYTVHGVETRFDVSNFTTYLKFSFTNIILTACVLFCKMHEMEPGLEELLQRAKLKHKVVDLLRIKPISKITQMYSSFTEKIFIFVVLLHILYMSIFSYVGCELMDSTKPHHSDTTKGVIYSFGLIEPILLSFYLLNGFVKCMGICCSDDLTYKEIISYVKSFSVRFVLVLIYTVFLCEVIASVDQVIWTRERYILSLCLLLGWLLTFFLANGIKPIHFFFKLVVTVMATDVIKIFLVYIIFLTGFSLSIHAQFISSSNITSTYKTPVHTMYLMFNVMMGIEEAVSEDTEAYLETASASPLFSKVLYMCYVLCSSIILLNLLIAMMNTSYSKIRDQHSNEWVCDATHFGIKTAQYFPVLARRLGVKYVNYGRMFPNKEFEEVWYISLSHEEDEYVDEALSGTDLDLHKVNNEIRLTENRLGKQMTEISTTQKEMMTYIQNLQTQITKLTSGKIESATEVQGKLMTKSMK